MNGFFTILIFTILIFPAASQAQEAGAAEKKALTDKAFDLHRQGKLDEAIESAAKVVRLEEKVNQSDSTSRVNAILNLSRMKRDNYALLRNKSDDRKFDPAARRAFAEQAVENARDSESLYRHAIELNEAGGRGQTAQTADAKSELGWLIHNFYPPTDKPSIAYSRSRIDEAERLFTESLALNEAARGKDAVETLALVLDLGKFYFKYDNFEKSLPFYERYISASESKSGVNSNVLADALRQYARLLAATFQDAESEASVKKIEAITGQKEIVHVGGLSLHLRSKDSVAFHSNFSGILRAKNETYNKRFKLSGGTIGRSEVETYRPRVVSTRVRVTVGDDGRIIDAAADADDSDVRKRAEAEVAKWIVRPFSRGGTARKMRGYLSYSEVR